MKMEKKWDQQFHSSIDGKIIRKKKANHDLREERRGKKTQRVQSLPPYLMEEPEAGTKRGASSLFPLKTEKVGKTG